MAEAGLNELGESIRRLGLVTPLTLRGNCGHNSGLRCEIIAGGDL